jgi:hypothetical protein
VVIDRKTPKIIGSSRYFGFEPTKREIEIGWTFLARSHWGGNYNKELKRLMLDHAFRFVESVVFLIGPTNVRSQKAVEKIGGVLRERREKPILTAQASNVSCTKSRNRQTLLQLKCSGRRCGQDRRASGSINMTGITGKPHRCILWKRDSQAPTERLVQKCQPEDRCFSQERSQQEVRLPGKGSSRLFRPRCDVV